MTQAHGLLLRRRGRPLSRSQREDLLGRLLTAPTLLIVVLVVLIPFVAVLLLSFSDLRLYEIRTLAASQVRFTLASYRAALTADGTWSALWTTLRFSVLATVGSIVVGLVAALALRPAFRGRGLLRAVVLIPYVLPVVAATTIWRTALNPDYGIVNAIGTRLLGWRQPVAFLTTDDLVVLGVHVPIAVVSVTAFLVWKDFPLAFLFVLARLQAMSPDLEEAAQIDGAGAVRTFWHIVLPQLRGVIALLVLLRFIWAFQDFNDIYLLTGGAGGTQVLAIRVYTSLITQADIGTASATGMLMSLLLTVVLVGYLLLLRRRPV